MLSYWITLGNKSLCVCCFIFIIICFVFSSFLFFVFFVSILKDSNFLARYLPFGPNFAMRGSLWKSPPLRFPSLVILSTREDVEVPLPNLVSNFWSNKLIHLTTKKKRKKKREAIFLVNDRNIFISHSPNTTNKHVVSAMINDQK